MSTNPYETEAQRAAMTSAECDFEETVAVVAEGSRISQFEAERIVRSWWEQASRLDFTDRGAQQTHGSRVYTPGASRVVGTANGRV